MPTLNIKSYNELLAKMEMLADGVNLHAKDADFPTLITEAEFRNGKAELENKRQAYDELNNRTRQAYDEYNAVYEKWHTKVANTNSILYGLFGKKSQVVADFGLVPHRPTRSRKTPKTDA